MPYKKIVMAALVLLIATTTLFASAQEDSDAPELTAANNDFAFRFYQVLGDEQPGNFFFAPFSISEAMAMLALGANGDTETQINEVLGFTLPEDRLHPAMQEVNTYMLEQGNTLEEGAYISDPEQGPSLKIANILWGEETYPFNEAYLEQLNQWYESGFQLVDFENNPADARLQINDWVSEATNQRINDILSEDAIDSSTRLVLINAIYFRNFWRDEFDPAETVEEPFTLLDGSTVNVPMMHNRIGDVGYYEMEGVQAVDLYYDIGNFSMLIIVPDDFEAFEASFDAEAYNTLLENQQFVIVSVSMPKFRVESFFELKPMFEEMGLTAPFTAGEADLSGIAENAVEDQLHIASVLHKTYVAVDEQGTEAAGVTVEIGRGGGGPSDEVTIDVNRPFIFLIRDQYTHEVIFIGRVLNPVE